MMKNKILKELNNLENCNMTRAEAELHAIRTTIEAYEMILKNGTRKGCPDPMEFILRAE